MFDTSDVTESRSPEQFWLTEESLGWFQAK